MSSRKRLEVAMVLWATYAVALGNMSSLLRERVLELVAAMGFEQLVDENGDLIFLAVMAVAVLTPLLALLWWHGVFRMVARALTPPDQAALPNQAGMALFQQGDYAGAVTEFTEAMRLNPRLAAARANHGIALFHLGKVEEGLADLNQAIRMDAKQAMFFAWRGQIWSKMNAIDKALADYSAALVLKHDLPDVLDRRAQLWVQRGEHDRALADFNNAIALGDPTGERYFARGSILADLGRFDRAIDDFDEAMRREGKRAVVYSNRGMAWLGKGDYDRAIADFDEAIRIDPNDGLFFNNRGRAFINRGEYAEAIADLHEAIRLTPTLPNSYKNLAWLFATCPEPAFRNGCQAVSHAEHALQLTDNKMIEWLEILAAAHAEAGNFQEAVEWQMRLLQARPQQPNSELERRLELFRSRQAYREET